MNLSKKEKQLLHDELTTGEALLWTGEPDVESTRKALRKLYVFIIPFVGIASVGFDLAGLVKQPPDGWLEWLFYGGLLYGMLHAILLPTRILQETKRTVYAVTNFKVLIIDMKRRPDIKRYTRRDLNANLRKREPGGMETLLFRIEKIPNKTDETREIGFYGIRDASAALKALETLKEGAPVRS